MRLQVGITHDFYLSSGNLNSDLHVYMAGTISTESSLQPQSYPFGIWTIPHSSPLLCSWWWTWPSKPTFHQSQQQLILKVSQTMSLTHLEHSHGFLRPLVTGPSRVSWLPKAFGDRTFQSELAKSGSPALFLIKSTLHPLSTLACSPTGPWTCQAKPWFCTFVQLLVFLVFLSLIMMKSWFSIRTKVP